MKTRSSAETKIIQKLKLKKNALDQMDFEKEWKKDPKYKTELCKGFEAKGICIYGNKCRFAHGKNELFDKANNLQNYKQKDCLSFFQHGFCAYGYRCNFKHNMKNIKDLNRSYYSFLYEIFPLTIPGKNYNHNVYNNTISLSCFNSPDCKKNNIGISLLNLSTASANSMNSYSSDNFNNDYKNYTERLNVFKNISLKPIMKNLCNIFNNFDLQSSNLQNCLIVDS